MKSQEQVQFFLEAYKDFKYPFRVGRKTKRSILDLDKDGNLVLMLDVGQDKLAKRITKLLNIDWLLFNSKEEITL